MTTGDTDRKVWVSQETLETETSSIKGWDNSPVQTGNYGAIGAKDNANMAKSWYNFRWHPHCFPDWFLEECCRLGSLAWSMFLLAVFSYLIGPVSLAFCGHLGTRTMDGVALALTVINVTGISIAMGLAMACGTFFSQSYGSVNKGRVGLYLVRSLIILLLFVLPCWAIHLNAEAILVHLDQEKDIAKIAGEYIAYFMPALPGVFIVEILMQYLRCQNIIFPTIIIGGTGVVVNAFMHALLLFVAGMGSSGSAISQVVAFNFMALSYICYILYTGVYKETWDGWKLRDVFDEWGVFLKLAISGMLMLGMEWWTFEVGTIMAGLLGPVTLGAQSIGFQLLSVVYMVPLGISLASTIRVGQLLGAEDHKQAVRAIKTTFVLAVICEIFVGLLLTALHNVLPKLFTVDSAIIDAASTIVLLVALYEVFDSVACVSAGILRGCGRQVSGAVVTFVGFYIIGLPIGLILMLVTPLNIKGYYTGLILGMIIVVCIFCFLIWYIDWEREVQKARERAGTDGIAMEMLGQASNLHPDVDSTSTYTRASNRCRACSVSSDWFEDYMGNYGSEQELVYDPIVSSHPPTRATKKTIKIIISRTAFALFMIATFVLGVVFRLLTVREEDGDIRSSTISFLTNSTLVGNTTLAPYLSTGGQST